MLANFKRTLNAICDVKENCKSAQQHCVQENETENITIVLFRKYYYMFFLYDEKTWEC